MANSILDRLEKSDKGFVHVERRVRLLAVLGLERHGGKMVTVHSGFSAD